jgi:hypothetical protein
MTMSFSNTAPLQNYPPEKPGRTNEKSAFGPINFSARCEQEPRSANSLMPLPAMNSDTHNRPSIKLLIDCFGDI